MNTSTQAPATPPASGLKMLQAMVGIGVMCALLIVITFEGTLPVIKKNKAQALEKAIFEVLPGITMKQSFRLDANNRFVPAENDTQGDAVVYAGYDTQGNFVGVAIQASGLGFADVLRILYGYDPEREELIGFHVLESKETPGLGDKIEKDPDFLANFDALDVSLDGELNNLKHEIIPVKHGNKEHPWEVDGITGATISSRAIGDIINTSAQYWVPLIYKNKEVFALPDTKK